MQIFFIYLISCSTVMIINACMYVCMYRYVVCSSVEAAVMYCMYMYIICLSFSILMISVTVIF